MILADKIMRLRKKAGWSQEELAEKLGVTRQAVSKWESAQSTPDLDKILRMGRLFGVSTDYLLKDEMEDEEYIGGVDESAARVVTMEEAYEFLEVKEGTARRIAFATALCILSPVCLLMMIAAVETKRLPMTENMAVGLGMIVLLLLVTMAVMIFISCGSATKKFAYLEKEAIDTAYGVSGMVRERKQQYEGKYERQNMTGVCLCILSVAALFGAICVTEDGFVIVAALCVMLAILAAGVYLFVRAGVVWASYEKLLEEGEYGRQAKKASDRHSAVSTAYWLAATAVYLLYSFSTNAWEKSWIVWPAAGVLYAAVMTICGVMWKREK